jgi:ATPase subunit of ABC transporter with duplicated ATPase domains
MLSLHGISYLHPNKELLFADLNLTINRHEKVALTGNNGAGKSTLLQILAGNLQPSAGTVQADPKPYYVPQHFGQYESYSVARALRIDSKLNALHEILAGQVTGENLALLADDWSIEERCREALAHWELDDLDLTRKMAALSGGQKTRVFLAGIILHQAETVLLDEPGNNLDARGKELVYDYIRITTNTVIAVSHDRTLLNLFDTTLELGKQRITVYGGNYDFYKQQKTAELAALYNELKSREKELRKAKTTARESLERQQKLDARGKKKQEKAGLPTIAMKTFKNNAEKSTARIKDVHAEKTSEVLHVLEQLRKELPDIDKMKLGFGNPALPEGKLLVAAADVNFGYREQLLWKQPLSFQLYSGERVAVSGDNGSGKTTLIKLILGRLRPQHGTLLTANCKPLYMDQDYSLVNNELSVYAQAQQFNADALQEHEIKIRLARFLFTPDHWDKPCKLLSGGEKMRLTLCSLTMSRLSPDLIILDEPTNNLDIQNIGILTAALKEYTGTLVVISHDDHFLEDVGISRSLILDPQGIREC